MRLFVAIDFPKAVKDQLAALRVDIPTARWSKHEQMHLTLNFIGETEQIDTVKDALAGVQAAPFDLTLAGIGRFPKRTERQAQVLWAGVESQSAMNALYERIADALAAIGIAPDSRPFSPHITLARIKTRDLLPVISQFMATNQSFQTAPIAVTEFILYSSDLLPDGPRYGHEAVYTLNSGESVIE